MVKLSEGRLDYDAVLQKFVENAHSLCNAIILVGSYVTRNIDPIGDIDLLAVTEFEKEIRDLVELVNKELGLDTRRVLDCKASSEVEIRNRINGQDNFYFWTCSQNYRLLHGFDFLERVRLIPQNVLELSWKNENRLREISDWLENEVQYTGACCYLYEILVTSYFIEKYLLQSLSSISMSKTNYIRNILQSQFHDVQRRYYDIVNKSESVFGPISARIAMKYDKSIKSIDYCHLLEKVEDILHPIHNLRIEVQNWIDCA